MQSFLPLYAALLFMENTGVYWQPLYEILEDAFAGDIILLVENARHRNNVPGKKTDMRVSKWIIALLCAGLLNGSFIDKSVAIDLAFRYMAK